MGRHPQPDPVEDELLTQLRNLRARGRSITLADLEVAIARLEPRQAEAMRLVYVEQLRPTAAARRMQVRPASVSGLLRRGRINLLAALTV